MLNGFHRLGSVLLAAAIAFSAVSCAGSAKTPADILTQTVIAPDKTPVTILVKSAFPINAFEKAAEEQFPQLDIIQVGNYTSELGIAEYEARLKHDDLTDIVMMWPLDVGRQYWEDRLLDLSSLPLSRLYSTAMLNTISQDGKLFYLPGPSQVRGIVYNKTLFEENGWEVPQDFDGFVSLCRQIETHGIRALQLGLGNPEVLDASFVAFSYESCFSKPENAQRLADYDDRVGSFADNFLPALETYQTLIDEGILRKEDLQLRYFDRERMLFSRQCAMTEDSVLIARLGRDSGCTDEFALMPFCNAGADNTWVRLFPVCYIGVNKHLAEAGQTEKLELVTQLLEYISTPTGQRELEGDSGAMFSALTGAKPPDVAEISALVPALTHGRYAVFPTLKNAQTGLRAGLAGMLEGTLTSADVVRMTDAQNAMPTSRAHPAVLGFAKQDFTLIETGNFLTDAIRARSGCEIALFLDNGKDGRNNGKGVHGRIYQGEVTLSDVRRILPPMMEGDGGMLLKVTMTGEELLQTLEYSILDELNKGNWFYYFSGLQMQFSPAAQPGARIRKITDAAGAAIDPARLYSVAVVQGSISPEYTQDAETTGLLIRDIFIDAVRSEEQIAPSGDGRFVVLQP